MSRPKRHFGSHSRRISRNELLKSRRRRLTFDWIEDRTLLSTFVVTSADGGSGPGTLTDAINRANVHQNVGGQPDLISFDIDNDGQVKTISPKTALPAINEAVVIDATTQTGYAPALPKIVIDGSLAGPCNGLVFHVGGNTVRGLVIANFRQGPGGNGIGLSFEGTADPGIGNIIQANFIGTDATGTIAQPNTEGIAFLGSSHNLIGGANANQGLDLLDGNLISGNEQSGIFFADQNSTNNRIQGNFIGTDVTGLDAVPNGFDGISMVPPQIAPGLGFASNNSVGSLDRATQKYDENRRNIISGNRHNGVYIVGGTGNVVEGNYIGVDKFGVPLPNEEDGVRIEDGSFNVVGGSSLGAGNTISGNKRNGVEIVATDVTENGVAIAQNQQNANGNIVQGNFIGTDPSASFSDFDGKPNTGDERGNGQNGIALIARVATGVVLGNVIGGNDADDGNADGTILARNIISGNLDNGVLIAGAGAVKNVLKGNFIGTDVHGDKALPNSHSGVLVTGLTGFASGPSGNQIGTSEPGGANLISSNGHQSDGTESEIAGAGITLTNGAFGNFASNNTIGTDLFGVKSLGNIYGVWIENSNDNIIGGLLSTDANVIAGNDDVGVLIAGNSKHNRLERNLIGVYFGNTEKAVGNRVGVKIADFLGDGGPFQNVIGGTQTVAGKEISLGNVISANLGIGVSIDGGSFTQVVGNTIGTDPNSQNLDLGNGDAGVRIQHSTFNTIGGLTPASRNIIVNNVGAGVEISDPNVSLPTDITTTTDNVVEGNYIGIGADGKTAQGNHGFGGVFIKNSASNMIGGDVTGAGNVISDNYGQGIRIQGSDGTQVTTQNKFGGNFVGTTADGLSAAPNFLGGNTSSELSAGVLIAGDATENTIGLLGTFGRNVISGNIGAGVKFYHAGPKNVVENNYLGTNSQGAGLLFGNPQQPNGVAIQDTPDVLIGGDTFQLGGNLISGNQFDGIFVRGSLSVGTKITGNFIGTNADGTDRIQNSRVGVVFSGGQGGAPSEATISGNLISGNIKGGLYLTGVTKTTIISNIFGTDRTQSDRIPNFGAAIVLSDANHNTIGGTTADLANLIVATLPNLPAGPSDENGTGIDLIGEGTVANFVLGNNIANNSGAGITIEAGATRNVIGNAPDVPVGALTGLAPGANRIGGNAIGVLIDGPTTQFNTILDNVIGLSSTGSRNGNKIGITLRNGASFNVIGSTIEGLGNVIVDSAFSGISLESQSHDNTIIGNEIGTGVNEGKFFKGLGNHTFGIQILNGFNNRIGGATDRTGSAPGNIIFSNGVGIGMGSNATDNQIQGNVVAQSEGFDNGGEFESKGFGIAINGSNNLVGGSDLAESNTIIDNLEAGVSVFNGTGNTILGNQIFNNIGLPIDLSPDGVNPSLPRNTSGSGANNLQNNPILSASTIDLTGNGRVTGYLESVGSSTFTLEFFVTPPSPATTQVRILSKVIKTNRSGIASFDFALPAGSIQIGSTIRATATDFSGDTSEYSLPAQVELDSDGDGISDNVEGLNGGDGNQDGIPDSRQANVVTVQDVTNLNQFVTLVAPAGLQFQNTSSLENPSPDDAPARTNFDLGFFKYTLTGLTPGQHVAVQMILPPNVQPPTLYYRYGNTPINPYPHWFDWPYDQPSDQGAEIKGHTITLHYIDGLRGDEDLTANGTIVDPGSPGFATPFTVTNTNDSGDGSLRQAMINANANPGADVITFVVPANSPFVIRPLSPLPTLNDDVTIDGLLLPPTESSATSNRSSQTIVIDGSLAGSGVDGLVISGGVATIRGLVINRFSGDGIHVITGGSAVIEDNLIGTDVSGKVAASNGGFGIEVENTVDNSDDENPDAAPPSKLLTNIISGNAKGGVSFHGIGAQGESLRGNRIGTQIDGTSPLGNQGHGILIDDGASDTEIGTGVATDGNTIAFNLGKGIVVRKSRGNSIRANSIFGNGGLAIDLGDDGVTANDPGDSDGIQNFPVITHVDSYGGLTFLQGSFDSQPGVYDLDFYASANSDTSGFGPGQIFLGSTSVTVDSTGHADLNVVLAGSVSLGSFVTVTAGPGGGGTSEFSAAIRFGSTSSSVFVVNTTDDVNDLVPNPRHFSLREAILAANSHLGQDFIRFDLPAGNHTIRTLSALPEITDPVTIDGTSQPGYTSVPLVEIDGESAGNVDGLTISGGGSEVKGLVINRFQNAITLKGLGGNRIAGNYLGTDITGTSVLAKQQPGGAPSVFSVQPAGVVISDSPDNRIGGTTPSERNVIVGVLVTGNNATGNQIEGDYIDTDVSGTALLNSDSLAPGVKLVQTNNNVIGGLDAGAGNLIGNGVLILSGSGITIEGNLIGTDVTGKVLLVAPNGLTSIPSGISIDFHSIQNVIGGPTPTGRNIIPGGLDIQGNSNVIQGNYLGTDITGSVALTSSFQQWFLDASNRDGVLLGGSSNLLGGSSPSEGNLISGFAGSGVRLVGKFDTLSGNYIGTDATGTKALPNLIGVTNLGSNNRIAVGNVISGNQQYGLRLAGNGGNMILGNYIGVDRTGTKALGNGVVIGPNAGILIAESNDLIGNGTSDSANVISGNGGNGVEIQSNGTAVQGNFIGTDITGTKRLGNGGDGVAIHVGQLNFIGGSFDGAGNVISANGRDGIRIDDSNPDLVFGAITVSVGNTILGNIVGSGPSGTIDLGNGRDGISIVTSSFLPSNVTIGGLRVGEANEVAFNRGYGISAVFGTGNAIRGNNIFANGELGLVTSANDVVASYAEQRGIDQLNGAPGLTSAVFDGARTVLRGTITGVPFTTYGLDLFVSGSFDPTGFGEGEHYLESISLFVDATGSTSFAIPLNPGVTQGQWISATLVGPTGETSTFSRAIPIVATVGASDVQFGSPSYLVTESGTSAVIVVTRTGDLSEAASVDFSTSDGTAKSGTNYTATSGILTFLSGQASKTITIPIRRDGAATGNLSLSIALANPVGATLGGVSHSQLTISDLDSAGQVGFRDSTVLTYESFAAADLVVTRTGGSRGRITVDYAVTGGTATPRLFGNPPGTDFVDLFGTLTFEDGQTTATIPLTVFDDASPTNPAAAIYEGPETIVLTLTNPTGGASLAGNTQSVVTINDDDDKAGGFGVGKPGPAMEGDGFIQVRVSRTGKVGTAQTVDFTTQDGSARAGINYGAVSGTLRFGPLDVVKFIKVPIFSDSQEGDPGSFSILLTNPTGGAVIDPGVDQVSIRILGNDSPGHFVVGPGQFDENLGTAKVFVQRQGGVFGTVTVDYSTIDGSAKAGSDYTAQSGTLTFAPGETVKSFTVPITPDNLVEGNENFFVRLSHPTGGSIIDSEAPVAETIYESAGQFQITNTEYQVSATASTLILTVEFDRFADPAADANPIGHPAGAVTVDYSTQDVSAIAGSDYTNVSGRLTFAAAGPGQYRQTIAIPILNNSLDQSAKSFQFKLSNPTGGPSLATSQTATIRLIGTTPVILADTTPPTISGTPDRPANARGWYKAAVTVAFTATDLLSGVATVTSPVTLATEGLAQSVVGIATDRAGNRSQTSVGGINVDLTKPVTTATISQGAITLVASDALSGIETTFYRIDDGIPQIYSAPLTLDGTKVHTLAFWSSDNAGNIEDSRSITLPRPTTLSLGTSADLLHPGDGLTLTATVTPTSGSGSPTGTVTFFVDGKPSGAVALTLVGTLSQATLAIPPLPLGTHSITASFNGGPAFNNSTEQRTVLVGEKSYPPTITKVQRSSSHSDPTLIVITFRSLLDPTSAKYLANYMITGQCNRRFAIRTALYDSATNTVTLRLRSRLEDLDDNFRLTIKGSGVHGVKSTDNIHLAGSKAGKPGTDFVTVINERTPVIYTVSTKPRLINTPKHPVGPAAHRFPVERK